MRILFLSHYFPPEVNAPANRTFEHCRVWVREGHEVHVVTCIPSHPHGVPFDGYRRSWYRRETMDGIHVHRVWTYLAGNRGVWRRSLNYLSYVPASVWRSCRLPGRFDVVIATSPQFFCALAGRIVAGLRRTPWVFELRDLWPESIVAVGAARRSIAVRLLERLELRLYHSASRVVCLTRSFIDNLAGRGVDPRKLSFVPNGVEISDEEPGDARASRAVLDLDADAVLVCYVGTVGMAHGLGVVLAAASRLQIESPAIRFLIVGDGAERHALAAQVEREGLCNVAFTGLVPRGLARSYLACSDVALILLKRSPLFRTVLPSKMFEAMAAGKAIILGVEGEAKRILRESGGGIPITPEDPGELSIAVQRLASDRGLRAEMGSSGRRYVTEHFDRRRWARRYLEILQDIGAGR